MVVRDSFERINGGDRVQVRKTRAALQRRGHHVDVTAGYVADLSAYDVVHLVNIMVSPPRVAFWLAHSRQQGKPVAVSTVYWDPSEWLSHEPSTPRTFSRRVRDRVANPAPGLPGRCILDGARRDPDLRSWARKFLTSASQPPATDLMRHVVQRADVLLPNGSAEGEALRAAFGSTAPIISIPNGVDDDFAHADPSAFEQTYDVKDFVLHVGRVESRKNLVAVADAVRSLGLRFVAIGSQSDTGYVERVRAAAGPDAIFIDELPYEQLGSAYRAAKVHVLASWFETPGLSNLEAALAGCNIVSTDRGTAREYFGDLAWYCDPSSAADIKAALGAAHLAARDERLRERMLHEFGWDRVAATTEQAYLSVVRPASVATERVA